MPVYDLFSKRKKKESGSAPDVFCYDEIPEKLRVQVIHILNDAYPRDSYGEEPRENSFRSIHDALCREYGCFELARYGGYFQKVTDFLLETTETEQALDVIELTFRVINTHIRRMRNVDVKLKPDAAIEELNVRFRENAVGYAFESNSIIRVDSQFIHSEAIKPALKLLAGKQFAGANEEFLKAHKHYREGMFKEAIAECLKAFESTMKTICDRRKWQYNSNDTAKTLIDVLFKNNLIPSYLQSELGALRTILESGTPTLRNRTSGHGQGSSPVQLPEHLASYTLHLTASTILFLCESDKKLK